MLVPLAAAVNLETSRVSPEQEQVNKTAPLLQIYRSQTLKSQKFTSLVKELNLATTQGFSRKDLYANTRRKTVVPGTIPWTGPRG